MKKYHVQNYIRWKEDMGAAIKRLPKLCPCNSDPSGNLYWNNSLSMEFSSDNATMQFLKSPGGIIHISLRRRPEIPPSSATPIIAVIRLVCSLRPLSRTDSPVPPPMATICGLFGCLFSFVVIGEFWLISLVTILFSCWAQQLPYSRPLEG